MIERKLEDLKSEFGTGVRVSSTTGNGKRGLLLLRDEFGGSILWDGESHLLHHNRSTFREESMDLHPYVRRRLREIREENAVASREATSLKVDPFDTESVRDLPDDV
jgi:hypothetical protein